MKNTKLALILMFSTLISNVAFASSPVEKYFSEIKILEQDDGSHELKTYEDIEGLMLNPFQKDNEEYPVVSEESIPEGFVSRATAESYFKKFTKHAILTESCSRFVDFVNEHLTLDNVDNSINNFPAMLDDYSFSQPGISIFDLTLSGGYSYVSSFKEYPPDALSCRAATNLCGPKCKVKAVKKKSTGPGFSGNRATRQYFGPRGSRYSPAVSNDTENKRVHAYGKKNIYSAFKEKLLAKAVIKDAEEIKIKNFLTVKVEDRTPPDIKDGFIYLYGDLGYYACTSNDWYKTPDLEVHDNNPANRVIYGKFGFGRLGGAKPKEDEQWENLEDWTAQENVVMVDLEKQKVNRETEPKSVRDGFSDVVKFNAFDGVIRYSVFLKENGDDSNTNPGISMVKENCPTECYGYRNGEDLGTNAFTAKPWPDKRILSDIREKGQDTNYIRVFDNDRPNIIIRVTDTSTGKQMFFPPCFPSGQFPVKNSAKYKAISGLDKTNTDDYDYFVKDLTPEYDYTQISENPMGIPYYTIYSLDRFDGEEGNSLVATSNGSRLLFNKDLKFINKNVRLEDYDFSDTRSDGSITYDFVNDELGKRQGTLGNMAVMFENSGNFVFKAGVEYKLDVWTDDNVKWTNINAEDRDGTPRIQRDNMNRIVGVNLPEILERPKVYETGIKEGFIKLVIPDPEDRENLNQECEIDVTKSINGGISFTLKDSTDRVYNAKSISELDTRYFPYIHVSAKDFAGFKREIRLYFRVNDKNLNIRALDPK